MKRYILYVRFVVSNYFRNQTWLAVKLAILLVLSVDIQATAGNVVPTLIPHVAESIGNDNVVLQPSLTIVGRVVNGENEPLAGVSISVKYGKANAVSEANGMYKITVPNKESVLVFRYLGFATQEIKVGERSVINIKLIEENATLNEVVVVGYGEVKRGDLTGSVASIQEEDIASSKVLSFQEAMQGKLAGVQISSSSGEPGAAVNMSIRGANTIYGATSPLFVIDGVPYDENTGEVAQASVGNGQASNPLASLNPSDIESIDVLKDASATAVYGSRGANGVVIITTKSGKEGRFKIEYDGQLGVNSIAKKMNVLSADEYIDFRADVLPNSPLFFRDTNGDGIYNQLDDPRDPYSFPQHDWQKEMLRVGISQNHAVSMSGGTKNTTFSGGLGYYDQEGIIRNNDYQRYTMRLRVDHQQDRLKLGINMNTAYTELMGATQSGGGIGIFNGIVQNLLISRPLEVYIPSWDVETSYRSPLTMIDDAYRLTPTMRANLNTYADYKITKDLSFRVSLGGYLSSSKGKEFYESSTTWGYMENGRADVQERRAYSWTNTNQLIYNKRFGKTSRLNAMLAFERSKYNYESFSVRNTNFADESTGVDDIGKGNIVQRIQSDRDGNNRLSYFGRVNYTLLNKHLFTATFRADGSDKFGPDNRFGYFPSFAYAWRISQERFMKDQTLFNDMKLRLSYGETGNERIPSFRYLDAMENSFYNGQLGLAPSSKENLDLKWETTIQYNAGLDFSMLKSRLSMTIDYYKKQTRDMLLPAYIPSTTGFLRQWQNLGRVDNEGVELQITSQNVKSKNFDWSTNFNISSNKNTVKYMGNVGFIPVSIGGGWIQEVGRVIDGHAIGNAYGYVFDGVYQIDDFTWQNMSDPTIPLADRNYVLKPGIASVTGINVKPGSFKFKDLNGDGFIDLDNDRTPISQSFPKFFGGINNTVRYKNFDLNFLFDWSYGNQIFNESRYRLEGGVLSTYMNITKDFWYNRWTPENPTNEYGTYADRNETSQVASSYYVEDASWLRLRNVGIGYQIPKSVFKGKTIQGARVYLTGSNLYTWTKYTGYDPEISSGQALLPGFDRISYPRSRTIMLGLNVSL
ncbi:TonB-dependent receptor [Parapedobacter sp. SGR-10]|uniref:SusC/RagA family TonB-linked outer membrane protein n=1 Tax=Parapedobacter sp. SGR-10 TaxID=2710879 RepID=UPI0013CF6BCE|nr:TonB-dependent receptor [Parapedobacter sp. SGR-10]NGF56449.1 TonB-dependent receptor [Parapedobacter sp. SGR-10]